MIFFWKDTSLSLQTHEVYCLNHEWGPCNYISFFESFSLRYWWKPLPPVDPDFSSYRKTQQISSEYLGNQLIRRKFWVKLRGKKIMLLLTYKILCLYDAKYFYPLLHPQMLFWEFNISLSLNTGSIKSALTFSTFTCMLVWNYWLSQFLFSGASSWLSLFLEHFVSCWIHHCQ